MYANPPWRLIPAILEHFITCKQRADGLVPDDGVSSTHALLVLPFWPWMAWYPMVMQNFEMVDY